MFTGNMKTENVSGCSSVHDCSVLFFWFSSLCHRDSPIMCFGEQLFYFLSVYENTRHVKEHLKQGMTSSSQIARD